MKLKFLLIVAGVGLPFFMLAQKGTVESTLPPNPIVVDGDVSEWPMEWMMEQKGKFIYNVCNDADNLYLRIKISDDLTMSKVGLYGMTVYLNPTGKKQGKIGLKYPVEKDLTQLEKDNPTKGDMSREQLAAFKKKLVSDVEVLELVGFAKENIVSARLGLMNGVEVFIKSDSRGDYVYEAKMPFKAFRIDKKKVKVLGIAFVTGKMPVVNKPQSNNPPPGGPGGGYQNYNSGYNRYVMRQMYGGGGSSAQQLNVWQIATSMSFAVSLK